MSHAVDDAPDGASLAAALLALQDAIRSGSEPMTKEVCSCCAYTIALSCCRGVSMYEYGCHPPARVGSLSSHSRSPPVSHTTHQPMQRALSVSLSLPLSLSTKAVILLAQTKRARAPALWTQDVSIAFRSLLTGFTTAVVPAPAYAGQAMPPTYLYSIPVAPRPPSSFVAPIYPPEMELPTAVAYHYGTTVVAPILPPAGGGGSVAPAGVVTQVGVPVAVAVAVGVPVAAAQVRVRVCASGEGGGRAERVRIFIRSREYTSGDGVRSFCFPNPPLATRLSWFPTVFLFATPSLISPSFLYSLRFVSLRFVSLRFVSLRFFAPLLRSARRQVPAEEPSLNLSDGGLRDTDVAGQNPASQQVTHLNVYNNDITRISGLHLFPSLLRITLRSNDLVSLDGIQYAPNLRWVDASNNNLTQLSGMANLVR